MYVCVYVCVCVCVCVHMHVCVCAECIHVYVWVRIAKGCCMGLTVHGLWDSLFPGCAGAEGGERVIQHTVVDETPGLPLEHVGGAIANAGTERGRERSHQ